MAALLLQNCNVARMVCGPSPYGLESDQSIAVADGRIAWIGPTSEVPGKHANCQALDLGGALVTPGLIDCHTHIVFGGNRAREFEMRLGGVGYEEIAKQGGGIVSTMKATRLASEDELVDQSLPRLDALLAEGVTTIEIKSGYGLSIASEFKMLRAARRLGQRRRVSVVTSWLAAHAVPPEYSGEADRFIDEVAIAGLTDAVNAELVDAVDGFCEGIAFDAEQISRLFEHGRSLGLPLKLHGEQLSNLGSAKLAASFGALSVDHLECVDQEGIDAMADAGTAAVLLPGAYYTLHGYRKPPVQELRDAGVRLAVATDGNPGSSPLFSILTAMNMACTLFGLTPEESLAGVTRNAAKALGLGEDRGTVAVGKRADLAVWKAEHPSELAYRIGFNPIIHRIVAGKIC